jgi:hypothetical protein
MPNFFELGHLRISFWLLRPIIVSTPLLIETALGTSSLESSIALNNTLSAHARRTQHITKAIPAFCVAALQEYTHAAPPRSASRRFATRRPAERKPARRKAAPFRSAPPKYAPRVQ